MTVNEVVNKVVDLLGYRTAGGYQNTDATTNKNMITYINAVYSDIFGIESPGKEFPEVKNIQDSISEISKRGMDALIYGVCMWVAFNSGDADKHAYFTHLYNSKRTGLTGSASVVNKIPSPEG